MLLFRCSFSLFLFSFFARANFVLRSLFRKRPATSNNKLTAFACTNETRWSWRVDFVFLHAHSRSLSRLFVYFPQNMQKKYNSNNEEIAPQNEMWSVALRHISACDRVTWKKWFGFAPAPRTHTHTLQSTQTMSLESSLEICIGLQAHQCTHTHTTMHRAQHESKL